MLGWAISFIAISMPRDAVQIKRMYIYIYLQVLSMLKSCVKHANLAMVIAKVDEMTGWLLKIAELNGAAVS